MSTAISTVVPAAGGTFTGSVNFGKHWHGVTTLPVLTIGAGAGTTPPSPVLVTGSTDIAGTITWGTGGSPNTQTQLSVAFNSAWSIPGGGAPHIVVTPINAATQALGLYISGTSPTGFNVNVAVAPAAAQGASTYQFNYVVVG